MPAAHTELPTPAALAAVVGSMLGTLANPFGWHIYRVAYDLASQSGVLDKINELQAMRFRDGSEFCVLFLALAASAALAWHRRVRVFEVLLLLFAAQVSFRSSRDMWMMGVVAVAILASTLEGRAQDSVRLPSFAVPLAALGASLLVWGVCYGAGVRNRTLEKQLAATLPVDAVRHIQAHAYPGPLYNDFNWGGYLIWALRQPVSIDGRAAFYGDAAIDRSLATWGGETGWASDPQLSAAGTVIGWDGSPLVQLLRTDARFKLVYEDDLATVFTRKKLPAPLPDDLF
jgi:hypothetical protein